MEDLSAFSARPRLAALLDHFAEIADARQGWKVMYPLREALFLVLCPARSRAATIATTSAKESNSEKLEASRCRPVFLHDQIRPAAIGLSERVKLFGRRPTGAGVRRAVRQPASEKLHKRRPEQVQQPA